MRLIILLVALVLITGCVPTNVPTLNPKAIEEAPSTLSIISPVPDKPKIPLVIKNLAKKVGEDTYKFNLGESLIIEGKQVKLLELKPSLIVKINVGKVKGTISETKYKEFINGLEITVDKFKFNYSGSPDNYVILKIKKLELGEGEHVLYKGRSLKLGDKYLKLAQVLSNIAYFELTGELSQKGVIPGETTKYGGHNITLNKIFYRNEQFVLIRIK